jgi:hypothetical protein
VDLAAHDIRANALEPTGTHDFQPDFHPIFTRFSPDFRQIFAGFSPDFSKSC